LLVPTTSFLRLAQQQQTLSFQAKRGICCFPPHYLLRRLTINLSVRLLFRVLYPRVGCPQGVTGCRPPEVLPSPPPCGWSTGFIETPRFTGRRPNQRVRPALPIAMFA